MNSMGMGILMSRGDEKWPNGGYQDFCTLCGPCGFKFNWSVVEILFNFD